MIVGFQHCRDKSFDSAKPALERIWSVQHPDVETQVVWTDDVRADEKKLKECYKAYKPQSSLIVGQVGLSVMLILLLPYINVSSSVRLVASGGVCVTETSANRRKKMTLLRVDLKIFVRPIMPFAVIYWYSIFVNVHVTK